MSIPYNLVVNADDFGLNGTKNFAISKCFELGIINSTSIVTNFSAFDAAIKLGIENGFQNKIGLHVNLTEGKPLTDFSTTKLVSEDGFFIKEKIDKKFVFLSPEEKKLVKSEIEAQLKRLLINNITPTHINSHHHVHTLPWLAPIFIIIAKKYNVKIRIAQTWNKNHNLIVPTYRRILNNIYKRNKINFTNRFETLQTYKESLSAETQSNSIEIMVHPDMDSGNRIYDSFDGTSLNILSDL